MKKLFGFDELIESFLSKKLTAEEFQKKYEKKYLEEEDPISEELFLSLDWLFVYVHEYTTDQELLTKHADTYFNEQQLREAAEKTLREIRALK